MKYKCLSIAGFDSSGGAGIQADLKTFSALGCYGMSILTALPVQNTCGVRRCYELPTQCIQDQLEAIFEDIVPDSIKIGMLFSNEIIDCVADFLNINAIDIPIVLDPVMIAKSGDPLLLPDAIASLKTKLIPLATVITPNYPEAVALTGIKDNFETIGHALLDLHPQYVLLKGGHSTGEQSNDLLLNQNQESYWLLGQRIESNNTHGTGCTLSAAIAAFLARGLTMLEACREAKLYLSGAIQASQFNSVGQGHGPVHHFHSIWPLINPISEVN